MKLFENSLWNSRTKAYFVITSEVVDINTLTSILPSIWSTKMINFVVISVTTRYQVHTYNAYEKSPKIRIPRSQLFCERHFPDKMKNLNGNPLRASINDQIPYTVKENGEFTGSEIQIYRLLVYTLKASAHLIEKPSVNESIEALLNNEVDIFLLRILNVSDFFILIFSRVKFNHLKFSILQVYYYINVDYSYPYDMVQKIIMVPKPSKIPPYMNMFYIFDNCIWIWLIIVINILPVIFVFFGKLYTMQKLSEYYLALWSNLLNVSTSSEVFHIKIKWLFFVWVWCSLILGAAFQSSLLGSYLKPNYEKGVKNLDDLRSSTLKLNLHPFFAASEDLSEILRLESRYIKMELVDARKFIESRDTSTAFLVSKEFAEFLMNRLKKKNGDPTYEILNENLISGVLVFHLQKHSPFLEKFDMSVLIFKQHGLIREDKYPDAKVYSEKVVLNLSHFLVVFCFLGIGLSSGLLVFFCEIYVFKLRCSQVASGNQRTE
ncbi:uncharacterized protein [Leptinotarsa decemlineata]|uniref:uncharacterized protein n=1 Tax=Leptinotarsa decemlineata TaxID=7539 RepID=UPI003D30B595